MHTVPCLSLPSLYWLTPLSQPQYAGSAPITPTGRGLNRFTVDPNTGALGDKRW